MKLYEKADRMQDDMRQMTKILLDVGGDKAANVASVLNCYFNNLKGFMAEEGISDCEWSPLPRDADSATPEDTNRG